MVSINGLPPSSGLFRSNKASKAQRKDKKPSSADESKPATHPTAVAKAVANSIQPIDESELESSRIHYDLPEGKSQKALQEYYAVYNQAKRDELAQMLGVDIYI
ncbi:chromosome partitioning protein ParA [Vibrio salinus]|uniref:chromosome partitioning protein ParA n=1 Tax=Vibrio salinus TaxID=2899784 RepID=UPI001E393EE4|nr:chromosome partitioning protein ParA [Vibrio salinus]MCE0492912.1 chromosome partitioning protein ParA [Vibrio salinus]